MKGLVTIISCLEYQVVESSSVKCRQQVQEIRPVGQTMTAKGPFTLSDFSKREACDFLLASIDTGVFYSTIQIEQFLK